MLPINEFLPAITSKLTAVNNLVLQAAPGAGKSTALPLSLLNAKWLKGRKILMLEPRRVAVKSIAHYLAHQLGEKVGQRIGYQIKNDRKISKETVLEIVTEGILTRRLQSDPEISQIGLIIFDEFHERSIHADLSLLLSLEIQQTLREDLKLLVMSATIDTKLISEYMGQAEIIECPGRAFPVSIDYIKTSKEPLPKQVVRALRSIFDGSDKGDILVFLPGQGDINRSISIFKESFGTDPNLLLLPLYGGLSLAAQEKALVPDPTGKRRIIFTTNIAETSLTIEGVTCVVDSGLGKVLTYDPASCMTRLETNTISKASADQRTGRAGRTQPGACIRLWDEQQQRNLKDYQGEEILSADLTGTVLELSIWGGLNYDDINWLTPPSLPHFLSAQSTLVSLGLIGSDNKATVLGKKAAAIGLPPRLATMLLQAVGNVDRGIACELAALLADRDIFHRNNGADIVDRLLALQDYKTNRNEALKSRPIKRSSVEQLLTSSGSLRRAINLRLPIESYSLTQLQSSIGKLLLSSYPDRLAKIRSNSDGRYQLANGKGVFLFDDDPLYGTPWLVVADCDAQKKEGPIFSAAAITFEAVFDSIGKQFLEQEHYEFNSAKQKITGQLVTKYGAITINSKILSQIPPDKFHECLLQIIQTNGMDILNWSAKCDAWLARAQWLGTHVKSFPQLSKTVLQNSIDSWLLPYLTKVNSIADLKKINLLELMQSILSWDDQQFLKSEAPTEYTTPSNKSVPIRYDSQQGPTVSVQLQEMFGQIDSPKIGGGQVSIRFELLSPARRPIQTTSDLGNFWENSYFEVAKEMKGKYPRHRWPDQPLLEKAGRSIKKKIY